MIAALLPSQGWRVGAATVTAGALAATGLAPFDLFYLGLLGLAFGLAMIAEAARPGRAAWCFGIGYFAVALHWIVEPFFVDAARHGWMAPFALAMLAAGMALFWVPAGMAARGLTGRWRAGVAALALCLCEGLRAYLLSGFPWAHPGHMLIDTPLLALASIAGPHGLNLVLLLAAAFLAQWLDQPKKATAGYLVVLAVVVFAPQPRPVPPADEAPRIRLVQPNAAQHLKWLPDMIPVFFDRALALTQEGEGVDLVVWPETALAPLLSDSAAWRAEMAAAAGNARLITGAQRYEVGQARNAAVFMDGAGTVTDVYDKHRLVPFGEYMPIRGLAAWAGIDGLAAVANGGYWPGDGPIAIDLGDDLGRAFVMICYEAIFPQYLRQVERPDWQLHLTNDAWFGSFSGPAQHLAITRLRAAESGLPVLRAANTGISAVIDARGQIVDSLPLNEAGALDAPLPAALPPTVYARLGDGPILLLCLLFFAGLFWRMRQMSR